MSQDLLQTIVAWIRNRYFGKYRGMVTDNADPTSRGRIKVRVPAVLGNLEVWAMPCVPYAGDGVGFYSLPNAGTGIWVEFEAGDASYPIWSGCFWADGQLPDNNDANIKIWKTDSITLRMDDSADELKAETSNGAKVTITDEIKSEKGGASHTVSSSGVVSDSGGSGKVDVSSSSVSANNGAWEVM
jgi:uncharacterized protein involved in type VI secretion and phage assembly